MCDVHRPGPHRQQSTKRNSALYQRDALYAEQPMTLTQSRAPSVLGGIAASSSVAAMRHAAAPSAAALGTAAAAPSRNYSPPCIMCGSIAKIARRRSAWRHRPAAPVAFKYWRALGVFIMACLCSLYNGSRGRALLCGRNRPARNRRNHHHRAPATGSTRCKAMRARVGPAPSREKAVREM